MNVHIISHTHWDREWFLTAKYTSEWLPPFFNSLFNMLERYPDYYFVLDGQTIMIEDFLDQLTSHQKKAALKKLKKFINQKRLMVGPYYLQADWRLLNGESLIRNLLLGMQIANELGSSMKVGWLLDNFGQISQAPQIHKGFELNGLYLWRGIDTEPEKISTEFIWEAPDRSQIVSIYLISSYRNAMRLAEYSDLARERVESEIKKLQPFATTNNILLMNGYDQEMIPDDILPLIKDLNKKFKNIKLIQSTPEKYLSAILQKNPLFQIIKGAQESGRYISIFPGTLSARMYLKQMNVECENLLIKWAEPISSLLLALGGEYQNEKLSLAWKELLKNHPHDNICGVSIDDVHSDMEDRFNTVRQMAKEVVENGLLRISNNIDTKHEQNIVVFNSTPRVKSQVVKIALKIGKRFSLYEADSDKEVPFQIGEKKGDLTQIYFWADSIPGLGYKTFYYLNKNKKANFSYNKKLKVYPEENRMENEFLDVKIEDNGTLTIIDKKTGRKFENIGYFQDGGDAGDTYNYSYPAEDEIITSLNSKARIKALEYGDLIAKFQIEISMHLPVSLTSNRKRRKKIRRHFPIVVIVELKANSPRVDFYTRLKNNVKDHRLRVIFPTHLEVDSSFSDRPFDIVESPVTPQPFVTELPENLKKIMIGAREPVPISTLPLNSIVFVKNEKNDGAALIARGLTEYEIVENNKIALTLFRSVGWLARSDLLTRVGDAGPMIFTPEAQCMRSLDFHYSFLPFKEEPEGYLFKQAEEFNTELKAVFTDRHEGKLEAKKGLLILRSDNANLVVSSIKKAEKDSDIIVRLFNPACRDEIGYLKFFNPIKYVHIVNLNEEMKNELHHIDNEIQIRVPSKKIITLKVKLEIKNLINDASSENSKILSEVSNKDKNDLKTNIPPIVSEKDILHEEIRAKNLEQRLIVLEGQLRDVEEKMRSSSNEKVLNKLMKQKINISGKVTTLRRELLEAQLSSILIQKKYTELFEDDDKKKEEQLEIFDSEIREIGLKLNKARVEKRAMEYLLELEKY